MATLNLQNYVQRKRHKFWLIKKSERGKGVIYLTMIHFPPEWIGRRVKLKVEEVD